MAEKLKPLTKAEQKKLKKRVFEADNLPIQKDEHVHRMMVYATKQAGIPKSTQVRDPFAGLYAEGVALQPPLPPEKLLQLAEENSVHGACLQVKAIDAAGRGWTWEADNEDEATDDMQDAEASNEKDTPTLINERLEAITPDYTFSEMLVAAAWEQEAVGWAAWEILRGDDDKIAAIYPIPAQTIRATPNDDVYVQIRGGRMRYFVKFGSGLVVGRTSGKALTGQQSAQDRNRNTSESPVAPGQERPAQERNSPRSINTSGDEPAAEVLIFKSYSPRSIYYGIPKWIDIVPTLAELTAIREFNVGWFSSGGQQDRSIHVTAKDLGAAKAVADEMQKQMEAFQGVGHTTLTTYGTEDVDVKIQQLDQQTREGHFRLRRGDLIKEVLMGHNVPPYRIGWAELGSLGGSAAGEMLDAYRFGSVKPIQVLLEDRLKQTIFGEKGLDIRGFTFKLNELEFDEFAAEAEGVVKLIEHAVLSPNEARQRLGEEPDPDDAMNLKYMAGQPLSQTGQANSAADVIAQLTEALRAAGLPVPEALTPDVVPGAPGPSPNGGPPSPQGTRPRPPQNPQAPGEIEPSASGPEVVAQRIAKSENALATFQAEMIAFMTKTMEAFASLAAKPPGDVIVNLPEPVVHVEGTHVENVLPAPRPMVRDVERDSDGRATRVFERPDGD